jgi:hypothetical protein
MRCAVIGWLLVLLAGGSAQASSIIVDTGPGGGDINSLSPTQWLAGEFTIDQDYRITGIQGWIAYLNPTSFAPISIVLYGDGGDVPDIGTVFFDRRFGLGASGSAVTADWRGFATLTNHEFDLVAGTYWVAFEADIGDGTGRMEPTTTQALANYAIWQPATGWVGNDNVRLGLRIFAIPEPGTAGLVALGLLAVGLRAEWRRRARTGRSSPRG